MRTRIPTEKVHALWKKQHPHTRFPSSVKVYATTKKDLNNLSRKGAQRKGGYEQDTKTNVKEYGRKTVSPSTMDVHGVLITEGRKKTIFVNKNLSSRGKTAAVKHELNHIYKNEH